MTQRVLHGMVVVAIAGTVGCQEPPSAYDPSNPAGAIVRLNQWLELGHRCAAARYVTPGTLHNAGSTTHKQDDYSTGVAVVWRSAKDKPELIVVASTGPGQFRAEPVLLAPQAQAYLNQFPFPRDSLPRWELTAKGSEADPDRHEQMTAILRATERIRVAGGPVNRWAVAGSPPTPGLAPRGGSWAVLGWSNTTGKGWITNGQKLIPLWIDPGSSSEAVTTRLGDDLSSALAPAGVTHVAVGIRAIVVVTNATVLVAPHDPTLPPFGLFPPSLPRRGKYIELSLGTLAEYIERNSELRRSDQVLAADWAELFASNQTEDRPTSLQQDPALWFLPPVAP